MASGIGGGVGAVGPKKKKKKPNGGNIVPVGGESAQGMYSGNTGKLIKAASQEYVVQKWDKKGKATYTPAFKVTDDGKLYRTGKNFDPKKYDYKGLSELRGPSEYSRDYQDKTVEALAREQNGDTNDNAPWAMFARSIGDVAPLRWAWSTFSTAVGAASNALEWYNKNVQDPYNHFLASAATFANPTSEGFAFRNKDGLTGDVAGQWSKTWAGTYGLDVNQALAQNPLIPGINQLTTGKSPWNTTIDVELGDTSGLTPEQKADAERRVREQKNKSLTGLDPAKPEDHAAIQEWSQENLLGKFTTGGLTFATAMTFGDPAFVVGKGVKVAKGAAQGANYLQKLGKAGFVKLVDEAASDLGGKTSKGKTLLKPENLDNLSQEALAQGKKNLPFDEAINLANNNDDLGKLSNAQIRRQAKQERRVEKHRESMRRNLDWLTRQTDEAKIANHQLVKGSTYSTGLAGLLAKADTVDDVALILKAGVGDQETLKVLRETRTWLGNTIDNMHRHNAWLGDFTKNPIPGQFVDLNPTSAGAVLKQFKNIEDEKAFVTSYIDDLRKTDAGFAQLLDPNMKGSLVTRRAYSEAKFSQFASVESRRLKKAERAGDNMMDTAVWQGNKWALPVRVVRWGARQKPNNWVQFAGVSDSASAGPAFLAWLQSSDQKIINPAMRRELYSKFTAAAGQGDDKMLATLDEIEREVMTEYAAFHGKRVGALPPEIEKGDYQYWRPLSDETNTQGPYHAEVSEKGVLNDVVKYNDGAGPKAASDVAIAEGVTPGNSLFDQVNGLDTRKPQWNKKKSDTNVGSKAVYEELSARRAAEVEKITENNKFLVEWQNITTKWQRKRDTALKSLGDRGGYRVESDGSLSMFPQWETQLAGSRPMIDLKKFGQVAEGISDRWDVKAMDFAKTVNSVAQSIYRPLVLLSLKYTLRNNFEAQLRALAVTGAATYDPNTIRAMGLNALNRGKKLDRAITGRGKKGLAKQEAKLQETLYGEEGYATLRDGLQADLDSLGEFMDAEHQDMYGLLIQSITSRYGSVENAAKYKAQLDKVIPGYEEALGKVADGYDVMNAGRARAGDYGMQLGKTKAPGMLERGVDNAAADAMLNNLSADETASMIFTLRHNAREKAIRNALTRENTIVHPENPGYWDALSHFASNTLAGSQLAKLRLAGASDGEFLRFINSPEGEGVVRFANQMGKDLHDRDALIQWYREGTDSLHLHFPDESIRQKILAGQKVSADELRVKLGHLAETDDLEKRLPAIAGTEVVAQHGIPSGEGPWQKWLNAAQTAFRVLGSTPESNLTRYPMGVALYKRHLARQVEIHGDDYVRENMDSVVRQAERAAVRDVKEIQYTVERYSNLAAAFEPVSPFFQAKANSMRVWAKLIGNDPSIIARAAQLWELTDHTVNVATGAIANADIPGWSQVMDATGLSDVDPNETHDINVRGIWSILLSQNPQVTSAISDAEGKDAFEQASAGALILSNILPQFGGPWVSPAASELYKAFAAAESDNFFIDMLQDTIADVAGYLSPQGASNSFMSWETVAPGVVKSAERLLSQQDSDAFNATAMAIHADAMVRWARDGAQGPKPTFDESVEKAKGLYKWEMFYQLTSPFGAAKNVNELDPIRDEIKALYDQGLDKVDIQKLVYEKYGFDYAALLLPSQDKFGGIPATMKAVKWLKANEHVVARYLQGSDGGVVDPQTASWRMAELKKLIPDLAAGEYDVKAASLLRTMNVPGADRQWYDSYEFPGASMEKSIEIQKGWRAQNQMDAVFDKRKAAIEKKYPGKDKKGSSDSKKFWAEFNNLLAARDSTVAEMKAEYKVWADETKYFTNDTTKPSMAIGIFTQMKADPKLWAQIRERNPEYVDTVETFLDFRNRKIIDIKKAGNPQNGYNRDATKAVKEERAKYEWGVQELKKSNTMFADMFKSFFQSELFDERGPTIPTPGVWVPRAWSPAEVKRRKKRGGSNG